MTAKAQPDPSAAPDRFLSAALADLPLSLKPIEPPTFDTKLFQQLLRAYEEHRAKYKPLAEIKVTQEQWDELLRLASAEDDTPWSPEARVFGTPVRLVETFEESTVYEMRIAALKAQIAEQAAGWDSHEFVFKTFGTFNFDTYCPPRPGGTLGQIGQP